MQMPCPPFQKVCPTGKKLDLLALSAFIWVSEYNQNSASVIKWPCVKTLYPW